MKNTHTLKHEYSNQHTIYSLANINYQRKWYYFGMDNFEAKECELQIKIKPQTKTIQLKFTQKLHTAHSEMYIYVLFYIYMYSGFWFRRMKLRERESEKMRLKYSERIQANVRARTHKHRNTFIRRQKYFGKMLKMDTNIRTHTPKCVCLCACV